MAMIANEVMPRLLKDMDESHEKMLPSITKTLMVFKLWPCMRSVVLALLKAKGEGRLVTVVDQLKITSQEAYDEKLI